MATNSGHSHTGQTHSGLPECDSKLNCLLSISTKSAHNNRVEPSPRNSEPELQDMGNSNSGHVCHNPQHASSQFMSSILDPRALAIDTLSQTGRGGRCTCFHGSPAQQSHSETEDHPGGRSDTNSPLVAVTTVVSTSTTSLCGPPSHHSVLTGPTVTTGLAC